MPNKPRGVARLDGRRVLNGIYWWLQTGSSLADVSERNGRFKTCYSYFIRWAKFGVWDAILATIVKAYHGDLQMIDSTPIRINQHGVICKRGGPATRKKSAWVTVEPEALGVRAAV